MEINATYQNPASAAFANDAKKAGSDATRESAREFEGMMLGMILKQGLISCASEDEEQQQSAPLKEYAVEQMARELGKTENMGIAKMLYAQLSAGEKAK